MFCVVDVLLGGFGGGVRVVVVGASGRCVLGYDFGVFVLGVGNGRGGVVVVVVLICLGGCGLCGGGLGSWRLSWSLSWRLSWSLSRSLS